MRLMQFLVEHRRSFKRLFSDIFRRTSSTYRKKRLHLVPLRTDLRSHVVLAICFENYVPRNANTKKNDTTEHRVMEDATVAFGLLYECSTAGELFPADTRER